MGWEHHHQRWATRHQTNFIIDTSASVFSNVNEILSHFNGILSYENGKYTLGVETQETIPASTNTFNGTTYNENVNPYYIEKSDIIGDIKLRDNTNKVAKNVVKASIPDPSIAFDNRSITFLNSNFLEADRNVRKTGNLRFGGITNYYNGRINAERYLTESRFGKEISFKVGQKGLLLKPGQVINLNYEPFKFTNKLFRITDLNFQADCTVTIKAIEYDDSSYVITAQRKNLIYSQDTGIDNTLKAPDAPTNLSVSTTQSGYFAISWDNASNFIEATDSTEVFAATTNNRANATLIATVDNTTSVEFLIGEFGNRFFWIRHKRIHRGKANTQKILRGAYVPSSATGGQQGVSKLMNPSFGFDIGSAFIKFNGSGTLNPSGTAQDTVFNVVKRGLSGTPTIQLLDADGTTRSGNSAFTDGSQSISGNSATIDASTFVSTDTPKIVKATLTEGGETFTVIASIGILKEGADGTVAARTTTGVVYFNAGSGSAPVGPDADNNATFTFATAAFTGLDSGWQVTPPTADPGIADPKFWLATFTAIENSGGGGTSSGSNLTFGTAQEFINFTNAVVFSDLNTNTSTVIHGRNISTGEIQSSNFTEDGSGNVTAGTQFDLVNNIFRSKEFEINATGDASFSGDVTAGGNITAGATVSANAITAGTLSANRLDLNGTSLTADSNGLKVGGLDIASHANVNTIGAVLSDQGTHTLTNSIVLSVERLTTPITLTIPATRTAASKTFIIRLTANPVGLQTSFSSIFAKCGYATSGNLTNHAGSPFNQAGFSNSYTVQTLSELPPGITISHKFTVTTSTSGTTTVYIYGFAGVAGFSSPAIQYTLSVEGTFR